MARKKETIEKQVVGRMKELGVYKTEYRNIINIFVGMLHQYEIYGDKFEKSNYQIEEEYTNKAGATNMRKTPLLSAKEKLRMDIATYSNMLCLNPKSFESVTVETTKTSKLASILNELDKK